MCRGLFSPLNGKGIAPGVPGPRPPSAAQLRATHFFDATHSVLRSRFAPAGGERNMARGKDRAGVAARAGPDAEEIPDWPCHDSCRGKLGDGYGAGGRNGDGYGAGGRNGDGYGVYGRNGGSAAGRAEGAAKPAPGKGAGLFPPRGGRGGIGRAAGEESRQARKRAMQRARDGRAPFRLPAGSKGCASRRIGKGVGRRRKGGPAVRGRRGSAGAGRRIRKIPA